MNSFQQQDLDFVLIEGSRVHGTWKLHGSVPRPAAAILSY
jgi:hypothetical protein